MLNRLASARLWKQRLADRLSEPVHLNLLSVAVYLFGGYRAKVEFDLIRPRQSAFGILKAADFAKELGIDKIYAVEFGVAAGRGLLAMGRIAREVSELTGVAIEVIGFDTGEGLPPPRDYRDHPEFYQTGDYPPIDKQKLLSDLPSNTRIIYGDIADTVKVFVKSLEGVVGYVSVDVDYYWSTVECLRLLRHQPEVYLPITPIYFDDVADHFHHFNNPWCGELLAIAEFNDAHPMRKLAPFTALRNARIMKRTYWIDRMYALHVLDHPRRSVATPQNRGPRINPV